MDDQTPVSWPASENLAQRVRDIFGKRFGTEWDEISHAASDLTFHGILAAPEFSSSTWRHFHLFINGRVVRDRMIAMAIRRAYGRLIPEGKFPAGVVQLEIPSSQVDVNVHPTKMEVRFTDPRSIASFCYTCIQTHLYATTGATPSPKDAIPTESIQLRAPNEPPSPVAPLFSRPAPAQNLEPVDSSEQAPKFQSPAPEEPPVPVLADARIVGQIHDTYIVCEAQDGYFIVDQHAAHERIRYEQLKRKYRDNGIEIQTMLIPLTVETSDPGVFSDTDVQQALRKLGIEAEPFGPSSIIIRAVPAILPEGKLAKIVPDIVDEFISGHKSHSLDGLVSNLIATIACHSVIRAGRKMQPLEMRALLEAMDNTPMGTYCPHGRPTVIQYPMNRIEREFGRTQ
jgi:DNA mismatch repair protein MutL